MVHRPERETQFPAYKDVITDNTKSQEKLAFIITWDFRDTLIWTQSIISYVKTKSYAN